MKIKQKALIVAFIWMACLICAAQPTNKVIQTDAHWLAGEGGEYIFGPHGEMVWNTNVEQYWHGIWKEDTNHWRVELNFEKTNTPEAIVEVVIGSVVKNSTSNDGPAYFTTPDGKFSKFELTDINGIVVPPKQGKLLERDFPRQISVAEYQRDRGGRILGRFFFSANGQPFALGRYRLNDVFSTTNEGDYTLTVQPVLYKDWNLLNEGVSRDGSIITVADSNTNVFERMDFPSVSAKIHLLPLQ
jgi:hypothetical protein